MRLVIDLKGYYDWRPVPEGTQVTEDDHKKLRVKVKEDGQLVMKVTLPGETFTEVSIPEPQITELLAHANSDGEGTTSRAQVVAEYLRKTVMPHHAHPKHFTNITVDGEPDVEKFLNAYFNISGTEEG